MYGELTDKETVSRLEYSLEQQQQDQFEILLYKKNSKLIDGQRRRLTNYNTLLTTLNKEGTVGT